MKKKILTFFLVVFCSSLFLLSCSKENLNGYEQNTGKTFSVIDIIGDSEFLQSLFYMDRADQTLMNDALTKLLKDVPAEDMIQLLTFTENLLGHDDALVQNSLQQLQQILYRVLNQDSLDNLDGHYAADLYAIFDNTEESGLDVKSSMQAISKKSLNYLDYYNQKNPGQLEKTLALVAEILAPKYSDNGTPADPNDDVRQKDLAIILNILNETTSKALLQNEAAAQSLDALIVTLSEIGKDPILQGYMLDMFAEVPTLVAGQICVDPENKTMKPATATLEDLLKGYSSYFLRNGAGYQSSLSYQAADLAKAPVNLLPGLKKLLARSDDPNACYQTKEGEEAVYLLDKFTQELHRLNLGLGEKELEKAIAAMMQYDGNGRLRYVTPEQYEAGLRADPKARPFSSMDQTVYTLMAASNFAFHGGTSYSTRGAPAQAMTMADSLISMGTSDSGIGNTWGMLFNGSAKDRTYRSREPFVKTDDYGAGHKFPFNSDGLCLDHLQGQSIGDVGIPEGGSGLDNVWNSYIPYSPNGKRITNTAHFSLGWIARACWEGEGPYFYKEENAQPEDIEVQLNFTQADYNNHYQTKIAPNVAVRNVRYVDLGYPKYNNRFEPVKEVKSVYKVYAPNGKLYGYQDAQDENIFYECHFLPHWRSDYFMGGYEEASRSGLVAASNHTHNDDGYDNGDGSIVPGFYIKDYGNWGDDEGPARCFVYDEIIPNGQTTGLKVSSAAALPLRICSSQEEAMYKNFQWLCYYKKFVFIIPMSADAVGGTARLFLYTIAEMNGLAGMVAGCKTSSNNKWAKAQTTGLSYQAADYRVAALSSKLVDTAYGSLAGGAMTPDIIGTNFGGVERMAFTQPSDTTGPEWGPGKYQIVRPDEIDLKKFRDATVELTDREKEIKEQMSPLLPVIATFMGMLHENASYTYNPTDRKVTVHNPFDVLTDDLMPALAAPMFYYDTTGNNSNGNPKNFYRPVCMGAVDGDDDRDFLMPNTASDVNNHGGKFKFFAPKPQHTLTSIMIDGTDTTVRGDGMMTVLPKTTLVRKIVGMLETMGNPRFAQQRKELFTNLDKSLALADVNGRKYYALETSETVNDEGETVINKNVVSKTVDLTATPEVIDVEALMNGLLYGWQEGENLAAVDYQYGGLAGFVKRFAETDADIDHHAGTYYSWERFNSLLDVATPLLSSTTECGSTYDIFSDLTTIVKQSLTLDTQITTKDLAALRHTIGMTSSWYDVNNSQWQIANETTTLLMNDLSPMMKLAVPNLDVLLSLLPAVTEDGGLLDTMSELSGEKSKTFDFTTEEALQDLYRILSNEKVTNQNSVLWQDLIGLIGDAKQLLKNPNKAVVDSGYFVRGIQSLEEEDPLSTPYSSFIDVLKQN